MQDVATSVNAIIRAFMGGGAGMACLHPDDVTQRITVIRTGIPASAVDVISLEMGISKRAVCNLLGITRGTASRLARTNNCLSASTTERAVHLAGLVKMVEEMIPADRAEGFNSASWLARWLNTPQPALAGATPLSYLDTGDGRDVVRRLLAAIDGHVYV